MSPFQDLQDSLSVKILTNEPLAAHCTYRVGGPADYFCQPENVDQLQAILSRCKELDIPATVIGKGSNLLISDQGIRGMVICLEDNFSVLGFLDRCPDDDELISLTARLSPAPQLNAAGKTWLLAFAGASMIDTSALATQYGLTGLEFACGIPGSVGGAVYMNAGAYGGMTQDVAVMTYYLDTDFKVQKVYGEAQAFGYRQSFFQQTQALVLATCYELHQGDPEEVAAKVNEFTQKRQASQPLELPSCGSVFKRPVGHFAGKLISEAGLQGARIGGAEVSKKHAGFIVNQGGATARDIADLIKHVQDTVLKKDGVSLETEVRFMGDWT